MDISPIALTSLNNGVNTAYNSQLWAAASIYKNFTYLSTSTGDGEVYPRLNMIQGLRPWVGERVVDWLTLSTFKIMNELFEKTIGVKVQDIEDDKFGLLTPAAQAIGQAAGELPDLLVAKLMAGGTTSLVPDGANFFDVDHVNYDVNGNEVSGANYQAAPNGYSGPSWYLMCTKKVLQPFIFQTRKPFVMRPLFDPYSESVFYKNEFTWGVDGRCNAGYGLWYLVFRSDAPLTLANLEVARAAMAAWRRPDGAPMGIVGDMLVTGTTLYPSARGYCEGDFLPPGDPLATGAGTVGNTFKGLAKAVENPWIS